MRSMTAVVLLVLLVLVAGCSSKKDDGPPPWSPTPLPSMATVPAATQSSPSQDELFAEAERVFRRSVEISARFDGGGDFSGFPTEMNEVAMGEYLATSKVLYDFLAEKKWVSKPGEHPIIKSEPAPALAVHGSVIALHVCTDSRHTPLYDQQGNVASPGRILESRFYFSYDTDKLLKISVEQYREVESCALLN